MGSSSGHAWRRRVATAVIAVASLAMTSAPVRAQESPPLHASNMGICSSQLAHLGVRAMVNHLILDLRELFGSPGDLYHQRAQENHGHEVPGVPQDKECHQR